jgi:hypothetical protein
MKILLFGGESLIHIEISPIRVREGRDMAEGVFEERRIDRYRDVLASIWFDGVSGEVFINTYSRVESWRSG